MDSFYFSLNIGNNRTLCLAPLTDRWIAESGEPISDPSGYFLFEKCFSNGLVTVEIIAQVFSEDAAHRLRMMLNMTRGLAEFRVARGSK